MWISTLSVSPAPPYVPLVMSERGRYLVELARPEAGWQDVQALASRARAAAAELTRTGSADQISNTYFETPIVADNLVPQTIVEAKATAGKAA